MEKRYMLYPTSCLLASVYDYNVLRLPTIALFCRVCVLLLSLCLLLFGKIINSFELRKLVACLPIIVKSSDVFLLFGEIGKESSVKLAVIRAV